MKKIFTILVILLLSLVSFVAAAAGGSGGGGSACESGVECGSHYLPPFSMAVSDSAPAEDVLLMADIAAEMQARGYYLPVGTTKLFSEVNVDALEVILGIYHGQAVIVVNEHAPASHVIFANDLYQIVRYDFGIVPTILLNTELPSDDLHDFFEPVEEMGVNFFEAEYSNIGQQGADTFRISIQNTMDSPLELEDHQFIFTGNGGGIEIGNVSYRLQNLPHVTLAPGEAYDLVFYGSHTAPLFREDDHCGEEITVGLITASRPVEVVGLENVRLLCEDPVTEIRLIDFHLQEGWNLIPFGEDGYELAVESLNFENDVLAAYIWDPIDEQYYDLFISDDPLDELLYEQGYTAIWVYMQDEAFITYELDEDRVEEVLREKDFAFVEGWNFYVVMPQMEERHGSFYNIGVDRRRVYANRDTLYFWDNPLNSWIEKSYGDLLDGRLSEKIGQPVLMNYQMDFIPHFVGTAIPEIPDFPGIY